MTTKQNLHNAECVYLITSMKARFCVYIFSSKEVTTTSALSPSIITEKPKKKKRTQLTCTFTRGEQIQHHHYQ
uniref:Uncharacterized protein n=1 Tax=Arundo donax TaxID=35708 RepID=A0A0A9D5A1_ARUDO